MSFLDIHCRFGTVKPPSPCSGGSRLALQNAPPRGRDRAADRRAARQLRASPIRPMRSGVHEKAPRMDDQPRLRVVKSERAQRQQKPHLLRLAGTKAHLFQRLELRVREVLRRFVRLRLHIDLHRFRACPFSGIPDGAAKLDAVVRQLVRRKRNVLNGEARIGQAVAEGVQRVLPHIA